MVAIPESNQPITLAKTNIIDIDGQSVEVPVNVQFRLSPFPSVVIESDALPGIVLSKDRFEIKLGNGAGLEAMVRSFNMGTSKGSLIPARQPVDVIDKGVPLTSVHFSALNFPELHGKQSLWDADEQGFTAIPHTKFETANWCIEITGVSEIRSIVDSIRRERGFGLTYNGTITRLDGGDFSVEAVRFLLEALRTFLSFARGGYCSLALVEGKDQYGEQSWVRWGAHHVSQLSNGNSWLTRIGGDDILSELFTEYWCLYEGDNAWRETILRATDWYLQSNEIAPYVGLILTLSALERLSFQVLGRKRENGEPTGEFIKKALVKLNVEPGLPSSCKRLNQVKNWEHGPHALTEIRNDLVHPDVQLGSLSNYVHHEAWNLGQWYVEMMLLSKLHYQGSYINRLSDKNEQGQVIQRVPWAEVEEP